MIRLAPGQKPAASEAEALAALRGADPDARLGALAFMNDIGWRASDELKAVFEPTTPRESRCWSNMCSASPAKSWRMR